MDFESERKRKIITAVEVLIVIAFFLFVGYQIWLYISVRIAKSKQEREVIEEQLSHSVSADGDAALSAEAISTTYEGEHPYSVVELPYGLSSLTIETENGSAIYTNGKGAGVNLDVKEIKSGDTVTAVDLSNLGTEYLSLSGVGGNPVITLRFDGGYFAKVSLNHAIQVGFNKDGDMKIYNLQKGDDIDITYGFNVDSYKHPGADKVAFSGRADDNGALSFSVKGTIVTVSGLTFESGMLSISDPSNSGSRGIPADGENGFFTYDIRTGTMDSEPVKK